LFVQSVFLIVVPGRGLIQPVVRAFVVVFTFYHFANEFDCSFRNFRSRKSIDSPRSQAAVSEHSAKYSTLGQLPYCSSEFARVSFFTALLRAR